MDVEWALSELRDFIELTTLRQPASGGGIVYMGDFASPVGRSSDIIAAAQVVEKILDRVIPRWRTEVPDDGKKRWARHRQAAIRAVTELERQAEIGERLGDNAPTISAGGLHPWVWEAARSLWQSGHYREAVRGDAFESYVGAQLDLLTHAVVHREITYDKDSKKSCDYIVITDECVLLIECKSGRPNIEARLGNGTDSMKKISKGKAQLETTAQLIKDRHTSFSHIPDDRPMLGLVVTLEPHYLAQTLSEDILFSDVLPITDATVQDLELTTAALADRLDLGERLRDRIWPYPPWAPRPPNLRKAVTDLAETAPRNPIVEAGWDVLTDLPAIELAQRNGDGSPPVASVDGPWDAADVGDGVLG